jgi:hypothetical protein
MQKHIAMLFLLLISMVSAAAGQSVRGLSAKTSSAAIRGLKTGNDIVIHILSLPGEAPVLGGETGQGILDLGRTSYGSTRRGSVTTERHDQYFTILTEFGLKLEKQNGGDSGFATLTAYLENPDSSCRFFLDGIQLSAVPRMISARVRVGNLIEHRLEIRVPKTAPAGLMRTSVAWMAVPWEG